MSKYDGVKFPNMDWFLENIDELVRLYDGEYLAIVDQKVYEHDITPEGLREKLKANKPDKIPFVTVASFEAWGV